MPSFTMSQVSSKKAGELLHGFLTDNTLSGKEADFKSNKTHLTEHIGSKDSVPEADRMQELFEKAGSAAMCVGSFDKDNKSLITLSLMPGHDGNIRIMTGVYDDGHIKDANELLERLGVA